MASDRIMNQDGVVSRMARPMVEDGVRERIPALQMADGETIRGEDSNLASEVAVPTEGQTARLILRAPELRRTEISQATIPGRFRTCDVWDSEPLSQVQTDRQVVAQNLLLLFSFELAAFFHELAKVVCCLLDVEPSQN